MRDFRTVFRSLALVALALVPAGCGSGGPAPMSSFVISNVTVVDGTGAPGQVRSVRVDGQWIVAVGQIQPKPREPVVDGTGLVLAPGFIDTDSRAAGELLRMPGAQGPLSQGVTTIAVGVDGESPYPLADWLRAVEDTGVVVNVAPFVGHATVRRQVMRDNVGRAATGAEVDAMRNVLAHELATGALGLSVDLEHGPGRQAITDEIIALGRIAEAAGGRLTVHLRSEDRHLFDAIDEVVRVGQATGMPVHINDLRLPMRSLWGRADEVLARLASARATGVDITADAFPYTYWQGPMTMLFPEGDYHDAKAAAFAVRELAPPARTQVEHYPPYSPYEGRTLEEVAAMRGQDPASTLMQLIADARSAHASEGVLVSAMDAGDVAKIIQWPYTNIASDAKLTDKHPRGYGAFARVLGPWVRNGRLTLEQAVYKMTQLPARDLGLSNRGVVRAGNYADLVLFDPRTVQDQATPAHPAAVARGIRYVWVNGMLAYDGRAGEVGVKSVRPGRILLRGSGDRPSDRPGRRESDARP